MSLTVLEPAWYAVQFSILDQFGSSLMKRKGDVLQHTLFMNGENPIEIARPGIGARFATDAYFLNGIIQTGGYVDRPDQRAMMIDLCRIGSALNIGSRKLSRPEKEDDLQVH